MLAHINIFYSHMCDMSFLTNGENIALVVVVRTYEHFLFPCTQRGPPLFSLAGRSRLSSIWFSYMHTAQPDRHYIGCNNQLGKLLNKKDVIYLDLGICHSWRVWGWGEATCHVGSSEHYWGDQNGEKGQIRGVGQNLSGKCPNGRCAFDLANKMPSALLIVLGPAFTVKNSQYLINDA